MKFSKAPKDPRGGHSRLYWDMLDSPAWNTLTATDQRAYIALRRQLGKTNNGDLSLPLSRARHSGITSPATLAKALRALSAVGLIAVTRRGGCTRGGQRLPTLYRFTCEQNYAMPGKLIEANPATDEWRRIESIAQGRAIIRKREADAQADAQKKTLVQKLNGTGSKNEAVKPITATNLEPWQSGPLQIVTHGTTPKKVRKANTGAALAVLKDTDA
jgi:hypothetical protein